MLQNYMVTVKSMYGAETKTKPTKYYLLLNKMFKFNEHNNHCQVHYTLARHETFAGLFNLQSVMCGRQLVLSSLTVV